MRFNINDLATVSRDLQLHVWTCVGVLILGVILIYLLRDLLNTRRLLAGTKAALEVTERTLDTAINRSMNQGEEIQAWRKFFGPFPSLYENSPEIEPGRAHNDMTIAIDLDGVILEYVSPWNGVAHFGDPIPGAAASIKRLKDLGYTIVIYTTRNNSMACHNEGHNSLELTALVQARLEDAKIPYDFIALFKPLARYYIDDRAVRFTSWSQALGEIGWLERCRLTGRIVKTDTLRFTVQDGDFYRE